jgi:hypothetical protein
MNLSISTQAPGVQLFAGAPCAWGNEKYVAGIEIIIAAIVGRGTGPIEPHVLADLYTWLEPFPNRLQPVIWLQIYSLTAPYIRNQ